MGYYFTSEVYRGPSAFETVFAFPFRRHYATVEVPVSQAAQQQRAEQLATESSAVSGVAALASVDVRPVPAFAGGE